MRTKTYKILYLITGLRLGGAEQQLLILAKHIQAAGNSVLVVAMEAKGSMVEKFRQEDIAVAELDMVGAGSALAGYRRFSAAVNSFLPDIIHTHMIHANLFSRIFKLFNPQYRLINTAHNISEGNWLFMNGYTASAFLPDWSTNVSEEAYIHYLKKRYFYRGKSSYLANAVDTARFCPMPEAVGGLRANLNIDRSTYVFLAAGRLHEQKNYPLLLNAFKTSKERMPDAVLVIAGEGVLDRELKQMVSQLGLQENVIFCGRRDDMPELLNMCDCFVLSSDYEGFGMVIAEAMATMKPVIATDCGGTKEVMGGYGKLVSKGDTGLFAAAMLTVYLHAEKEADLVAARNHVVARYAIPKVIGQWKDLYTKILNDAG